MHLNDEIFDDAKKIDQRKIEHIARLGADWYCRVNESNLFRVPKPNIQLGIGIDALPQSIRQSSFLSGNDLGQLANVNELPQIDPSFEDAHLRQIILYYNINPAELEKELHTYAKELLKDGKLKDAWQVLLALE